MGNDEITPTTTKRNLRKYFIIAFLIGGGSLVVAPLVWNALGRNEEERLQRRLQEIDDAEQYALLAEVDGWYPCNHPGRKTYFLKESEVWKYGTTTKGKEGRYGYKYLQNLQVSYIVQFQGTIAECLKEEQRKLFNYPYLPENLARPESDHLPRPPYNSKMQ